MEKTIDRYNKVFTDLWKAIKTIDPKTQDQIIELAQQLAESPAYIDTINGGQTMPPSKSPKAGGTAAPIPPAAVNPTPPQVKLLENIAEVLGSMRQTLDQLPKATSQKPVHPSSIGSWVSAGCCLVLVLVGIGNLFFISKQVSFFISKQVSRSDEFEKKTSKFLGPEGGLASFEQSADKLKEKVSSLDGDDSPQQQLKKAARSLEDALTRVGTAKGELDDAKKKVLEGKASVEASKLALDSAKSALEKVPNNVEQSLEKLLPLKLDQKIMEVSNALNQVAQLRDKVVDLQPKTNIPTRILISDTAYRNIEFLRTALADMHFRIAARTSDLQNYDLKILLPIGDRVDQQYDPSKQYFRPSPNATVDWRALDIAPLFPAAPPNGRCIIVCDGMTHAPRSTDDNWKSIKQVDVVLIPPGPEPLEKTMIKQWQTFAREKQGAAIVVSLMDSETAPIGEQQANIVASVLRGIIDGPLTRPSTKTK